MRFLLLITFGILQLSVNNVHATGKYTVIGPGTIHSDRQYNVAVAVHNFDQPCTIQIGIIGPSYNATKVVKIENGNVKNVVFDLPVLEDGTYNLTAEGVVGMVFKNTTKLIYEYPTPILKIQTDKGTYKPGDTINFRVLQLDENLKPAKPSKETIIWIEDAKRNRIKEYKNPMFIKGVFTEHFPISEYPNLGGWRLLVSSGGPYPTSAYFNVDKYVLPKYKVSVEGTESVSVKDGDLQLVVRANYTYGEPVNGKATVLIDIGNSYFAKKELREKEPLVLIKSTDMVNGKAKFAMDVKAYAEYMESDDDIKYMTITATVEEAFTGVKINATTSSGLFAYRYTMSCIDYSSCSIFEADVETEMLFRLTLIDKTPLNDTKSVVKLIITETVKKSYTWNRDGEESTEAPMPQIEPKIFTYESHMNGTGIAAFKVKLTDLQEFEHYRHYYEMEMQYLDEKRQLPSLYQYRKPKDLEVVEKKEPTEYFFVTTNYEKDKYRYTLGEKAIFTLNSSQPMAYFVYSIIGRGNIQHSERVELPDKPKVYNMTYTTTFQTSPDGKLYVYFVDEQGELHYDESYFNVDVVLQNTIDIQVPEKVKPGEDVALKIKTAPDSFVGLVAVDQSVLLLSHNNDIKKNEFRYRLHRYSTQTPSQGGYSRYPGELSGVVTLTNANYFYNWTSPFKSVGYGLHENLNRVAVSAHMADSPSSGGGAPSVNKIGSNIAVRKDFSEVWLFDDIVNTLGEEFTYVKKIPDTITSWVLTGFSLNSEKGLGVVEEPSNIITFQPFFVSIRLPYSVKRGEVINVPALVFNYLDKDLDVDVTLDNTDEEFEFTEISNEVINEEKRVQTLRVPAFSARGVAFLIRPKIIGNIMLKFTAISPLSGDAIHKTLKVVPEGVTEYANRAYFVNLKNAPEFRDTFELDVPKEVIPDSEHIEFTVVGDLLGPVLNNLENLVRMPGGCGEQTISRMYPNLLVINYLKRNNKLTPMIERKIKRNLVTGYQNILRYQHKDGSFSTFGPTARFDHPINGSTWLTAYVVRALHEAKEYVDIKMEVLLNGVNFLKNNQAANGSFIERGSYFYSNQKNHIALTASVMLALLETTDTFPLFEPQMKDVREKALAYIKENLPKTDNLHSKALGTYVLHKGGMTVTPEQLKSIKSLAKSDNDLMWWSNRETGGVRPWWRWSFSNEVESTSYFLLTLLETPNETVESVLPIVRWLVAQRNSYGGFSSTQDTVVGLMALMKFTEVAEYEPAVMDIEFTSTGAKTKTDKIFVTDDNALLLQVLELPQKTSAVEFNAKGKGAALVQVSYQYNVVEKEKKPEFTITTHINKEAPPFKLEMMVCVEYTGDGAASNMAIVEISLPSGYVADEESFDDIRKVNRVRQVESKNSNTHLDVYFDNLYKNQSECLPIEGIRSFPVALQKPASIVIYDYYDTSKRATNYYEVMSKMCDLCENNEECLAKCK